MDDFASKPSQEFPLSLTSSLCPAFTFPVNSNLRFKKEMHLGPGRKLLWNARDLSGKRVQKRPFFYAAIPRSPEWGYDGAVPGDFMHESNEVEWETFEDLARVLTPLVASLVTTEGYVPPLDVSIVDALNHLVICMEMNSHGVFRNIADLHTALRPTLPMVITVTDSTGRTWKSPLTPPA